VKSFMAALAVLILCAACGVKFRESEVIVGCVGSTLDIVQFASSSPFPPHGRVIRLCEDGSKTQVLSGREFESPRAVGTLPNGNRVVISGGWDSDNQRVSLISPNGAIRKSIQVRYCPAGLIVLPSGKILISHGNYGAYVLHCESSDGEMTVYNADLLKERSFRILPRAVNHFMVGNHGDILAYATQNGALYDISGDLKRVRKLNHVGGVNGIAIRGKKLVVASGVQNLLGVRRGKILVFNDYEHQVEPSQSFGGLILPYAVEFASDHDVYFSDDQFVIAMDLRSGAKKVVLGPIDGPRQIVLTSSAIIIANRYANGLGHGEVDRYDRKTRHFDKRLLADVNLLESLRELRK